MQPSRRTLVADAWASYLATVVPPGASKVQIDETRKAFYAGAFSAVAAIVNSIAPGQGEPTEADMAVMDDVVAERDAWQREIDLEAKRYTARFGRPPA